MVISLNTRNAKREKTYYNSRFHIYGYDPRSLGWIVGYQETRFKNLTMIGDLNDCSILDVGCGFGDLYGYLSEQGIHVDYTGVDINRNFIRTAKEIYPGARFIEGDFEDIDIRGKFDWSFASGIFNLKIDDNRSFIENTMRKMFKLCRKGIAADFLDGGLAIKGSGLYYQGPEAMLELCNELSDHVLMRHDYLPTDFCVYVYKDDTLDETYLSAI